MPGVSEPGSGLSSICSIILDTGGIPILAKMTESGCVGLCGYAGNHCLLQYPETMFNDLFFLQTSKTSALILDCM